MPLHVICSGCLKRFQVGVRFAGMKGPCPNCGTIIEIPKESVKLHESDAVKSGKGKKQRTSIQVIPRADWQIDPVLAKQYAWGVLGVLVLTFLFGCIPMYAFIRSFFGMLGLCLIAFPLTLFGYHAARDRDEMFTFSSDELYQRVGITAVGYVILWFAIEYCLAATKANVPISCCYFLAFAGLATLLTGSVLVMKTQNAFLHYCIFGFVVILLRFLLGLGWFWESSEFLRYSAAPPPPFLPGM
jgi:hypothetical protein